VEFNPEDVMFMQVVAVIEDDTSLRTAIARLLRAHGFVSETYATAEQFLDGFAANKANCVLIDIHLGTGLSGIELCKRLTASGRSLNVILMTAIDIEQNETKAIEAGCNAYLQKPFSTHSLIGAIEKTGNRH